MLLINQKGTRVLNYTHIDFDGCVSAIVVNNFYDNVKTIRINYGDEAKIMPDIQKAHEEFDAIIFTDFCPDNLILMRKVCKLPIYVFDHHEFRKHFATEPATCIKTDRCGAKLLYDYYSRLMDLSYLKELVDITNDFDIWLMKDPNRSLFYNSLFWEYGHDAFFERYFRGDMNFREREAKFAANYKKKVQKAFDKLEAVELPNKGIYFKTCPYVSELTYKLGKEYDYLIIRNSRSLSVRARNDKIDLCKIATELGIGGGHPQAIGVPFHSFQEIGQLINRIIELIGKQLG